MRRSRIYENSDERSEMIDQLCEMGYEKSECDAMSYEELCDCMKRELSKEDSWKEEEVTERNVDLKFKHLKSFESFNLK